MTRPQKQLESRKEFSFGANLLMILSFSFLVCIMGMKPGLTCYESESWHIEMLSKETLLL